MRITDLLDARSISLQAAPGNKEEALNQAAETLACSFHGGNKGDDT